MKQFKFVLLATAFSAFALTGCFESETETNTQNTSSSASADAPAEARVAQAAASSRATAPNNDISGIYCVKTDAKTDALAIMNFPQSQQLSFSFSTWNNNSGHSCGAINALADKISDNEWLYTNKDFEECKLSVSYGDGLTITTAEGSDCRALCGARMQIGTLTFSETSKKTSDVTTDDVMKMSEKTDICE